MVQMLLFELACSLGGSATFKGPDHVQKSTFMMGKLFILVKEAVKCTPGGQDGPDATV